MSSNISERKVFPSQGVEVKFFADRATIRSPRNNDDYDLVGITVIDQAVNFVAQELRSGRVRGIVTTPLVWSHKGSPDSPVPEDAEVEWEISA